jgi:hypothetical protein
MVITIKDYKKVEKKLVLAEKNLSKSEKKTQIALSKIKELKKNITEIIQREPRKAYAIQGTFNITYRKKEGEENGVITWSDPLTERFLGRKVLKKYLEKSRKVIMTRYILDETKYIHSTFDAYKDILKIEPRKIYEDGTEKISFMDIPKMKMYGSSVHLSMPSIGATYKDYDNKCVPLQLLKYFNNPEEKNKDKRLKSFTIEKIIKLLNQGEQEFDLNRPLNDYLVDGYSAYQVMKVCDEARVRMYCLDHREHIMLSNAESIPDNKRNKNIPSLVFMCWNEHFYLVENNDVRISVANTYKCSNGSSKPFKKKTNELTVEEKFQVLTEIPNTFDEYKNITLYIVSHTNLVNDFFFEEIQRGNIHKEGLKMKDKIVLSFIYSSTNTKIVYSPDFYVIKSICDNLNAVLSTNEKPYDYKGKTVHSLAMEYFTRNYKHELSFLNNDGDDVMSSPLNSAWNEYYYYPDESENIHAYDFNKHYRSCLTNNKWGFSVYSPVDEVKEFSGKIVEGFYYIITENYIPMKGNGWYSGECVAEYVEDGLISKSDILYEYLPSTVISTSRFKSVCEDVDKHFGSSAKDAINGFIGLLRKNEFKSVKSYFTNNVKELCCHYTALIENDEDISSLPVNYIENEEGEIVCYHIMREKKNKLTYTNLPIYRKIYDMSALYLWRLIKNVGTLNNVWGIHADTVYFSGGIVQSEEREVIGGIREVKSFKKSDIKKYVSKRPFRKYKYVSTRKNNCLTYVDSNEYNLHNGALILGAAGCGKSTLVTKLYKYFTDECNVKCAALAPTHLAAANVYGETIHEFFGIDPFHPELNISRLNQIKREGYKIIFIDELSMINLTLWGLLHQIKKIYDFKFYLVGDFGQLPPVGEDKIEIHGSKLINYICDFREVNLSIDYRAMNDPEYAVFAKEKDKLRNGENIDKSLFGTEECEFAIAYYNETVNKHNMKYMKINAEKAGCYEILNKKDKVMYLFNGLKVIANETTKEYYNCQTFVVDEFDKSCDVFLLREMKSGELVENGKVVRIDDETFLKHFEPYYAVTVHRSQGQTFAHPFTIYEYDILYKIGHRYAYTAITRSTCLKNINLLRGYVGEVRGYIYKYTNVENGLVYIGSTFDIDRRMKEHKESTDDSKFHVALRKGKFDIEILCKPMVDSEKDLFNVENRFIVKYNSVKNGYNSRHN